MNIFNVLNTFIQWKNQDAIGSLKKMSKLFGTPSNISRKVLGLAIWRKNILSNKKLYDREVCFCEIQVVDESILHKCPRPHSGNLYTSIKISINPDQLLGLSMISGTITYDALKKQLTVRGGNLESNISTLNLCVKLLLGIENINNIRQNQLFSSMMIDSINGSSQLFYYELCDLLSIHNKNNNIMPIGYWKGAFNEECEISENLTNNVNYNIDKLNSNMIYTYKKFDNPLLALPKINMPKGHNRGIQKQSQLSYDLVEDHTEQNYEGMCGTIITGHCPNSKSSPYKYDSIHNRRPLAPKSQGIAYAFAYPKYMDTLELNMMYQHQNNINQ